MTRRLRLYVDERWPREARLAWALLGASGSLIEEGESEPGHWPAADECEAVLSAPQAVWLRTRLPERLPRGEAARLLANALEDQLLDDPERQHLTVTGRRDGEVGVLVVARERLRSITTAFAALGRPLAHAYSELQLAPADVNGWHLALGANGAILRRGAHDGVALDAGPHGAPPPLLAALLRAGEPAAPPVLTVHARDASASPDLDGWRAALGVELRAGPPYRWYAAPEDCADLLREEFAPAGRRKGLLGRLAPALWVAGAFVALDIAAGIAQIGWHRYRTIEAGQRMEQLFRSAFPSIPPVDPAAQVRRQLEEARSRAGMLRADDALALLAGLAEALGAEGRGAMQAVRFENGVLEVTLAASAGASLQERLAVRGIEAGSTPAGTLRLAPRRDTRR